MTVVLAILFFIVAILYAAVGHGGGSGYLAAMALMGVDPEVMRATALTLNILVASIGTWKFYRAGHFSGAIFWPVAATSIPFAFIGGRLTLATAIYRPIVGLILLYAAIRLFSASLTKDKPNPAHNPSSSGRSFPLWMALLAGAGIGLLSGLVGVGGGIFLTPLLLLAGWADTREAMGVSAAFVLVNSIAGLLGRLSDVATLPAGLPLWLLVAGIGGWLGAEYGSRRLNTLHLRRLLALVLLIGGLKMIWA